MPIILLLFQLQTIISGVSDVSTLAAFLLIADNQNTGIKFSLIEWSASLVTIFLHRVLNFGSEITETLC